MKRLLFLLLLIPVLFFGQEVYTYQGGNSLVDDGKGIFTPPSTESWITYGTNTIENDGGALKITYVNDIKGASVLLSIGGDLSTNLVIDKTYRIRAKVKVNAGTNVELRTAYTAISSAPITNTTFEWTELIFTCINIGELLRFRNFGAGEILWMDEWTIQEWTAAGKALIYGGKVIASSWDTYWESRSDYWVDALSSDGLSLVPRIGTGGSPKDFACAKVELDGTELGSTLTNSLQMPDSTAIYEYYLETVLNAINDSKVIVWNGASSGAGAGIRFVSVNTAVTISISDGATRVNVTSPTNVLQVGLNKILVRFNCPTKDVYINVNGIESNEAHGCAGTLLYSYAKIFSIGDNGDSKWQQPIYFYLKKNDVIISEYIFSNPEVNDENYIYRDLNGTTDYFSTTTAPEKHNLINKFKNGYKIYVQRRLSEDDWYKCIPLDAYTVDVTQSGYELLGTIDATEIGYKTFAYIEMPDLPIFDTSNRTYWKESIEADDYYVGDVEGKERYFHMSWLNYTWLNVHIAYDYLYKVVARNIIKTAAGMDDTYFQLKDLILAK